jgi:flagellar basal body-associated protein FliL
MKQQGLTFLKTLTIQEIHEKTHISFVNIEAILNRSYGKLERVNLVGFISILQREYEIDLSDFMHEFEQYTQEHADEVPKKVDTYTTRPTQKSSNKIWWILLLVLVAVAAFFYTTKVDVASSKGALVQEVNDSQIQEAKEKMQESDALQPYLQKVETNSSDITQNESNSSADIEENLTETVEVNETNISNLIEAVAPKVQNELVLIMPKKKVWIGMIDLDTMQKTNRVTARTIKVDSNKNWLIVFGHGYVSMDRDGELLSFSKRGKLYFSYKEGKLKEITKAQFKKNNRGKSW